jgi:hypothetical protein
MSRVVAELQLLQHAAAREEQRLVAAHAIRVVVVVLAGFLFAGFG